MNHKEKFEAWAACLHPEIIIDTKKENDGSFSDPTTEIIYTAFLMGVEIGIEEARMKQKIKVFQLNEYESYAGESLEDCIRCAMKESGEDREDVYDETEAFEYTEEAMKEKRLFLDESYTHSVSFREELDKKIANGEGFPCLFSCRADI